MRKILFAVFVLAALPSLLRAEIPVSKYDAMKNSEEFKLYINGMGAGLFWANAFLESKVQPPIYCPPPKLKLQQANYLSILDDAVQEWRKRPTAVGLEDPYIEPLLVRRLQEVFPCQTPKP